MNPLIVIGIPVVLVITGMILNSFGLSFDKPADGAKSCQEIGSRKTRLQQILCPAKGPDFEKTRSGRAVCLVAPFCICRVPPVDVL